MQKSPPARPLQSAVLAGEAEAGKDGRDGARLLLQPVLEAQPSAEGRGQETILQKQFNSVACVSLQTVWSRPVI